MDKTTAAAELAAAELAYDVACEKTRDAERLAAQRKTMFYTIDASAKRKEEARALALLRYARGVFDAAQ